MTNHQKSVSKAKLIEGIKKMMHDANENHRYQVTSDWVYSDLKKILGGNYW